LGVFLVYTGIRAVRERPKEIRPKHHPVLRLFRRFMPITDEYEGGRFTVKKGGRRFATPLLVTLLMVETTDLIFAMDSIPAILAITVHPSVVYSSNAFAILGLRALYFALAGLILQVRYLKYGVCAILVYVGIKMLLHDVYKIPVAVSLGVIVGMIAVAVLASFAWPSAATPGAGRPERDIRLDVTQAQNDDQAGELGVLPRSTQECTQAGSGIKRMNESQRTVKNHGRKAD
jgi:tellurite resistance protein TerC